MDYRNLFRRMADALWRKRPHGRAWHAANEPPARLTPPPHITPLRRETDWTIYDFELRQRKAEGMGPPASLPRGGREERRS